MAAAKVFWESFSKATMDGFYNASLMGRYNQHKDIQALFLLVLQSQIQFQVAATSENAPKIDIDHYREERSNARRIAVRI